jgi:hypothetical protein
MRLTISGRWTGNNDTADFIDIRKGSSDAAWAISFFRIEHVFDPGTHAPIPVPHDLSGWFTSHPAVRVLSSPRSTTIGGRPGTWFDVELAPGWSCGNPSCVSFAPLNPGEPDFGWSSNGAPNVRARIFVLRVRGAAVIVSLSSAKGRFLDGVDRAQGVLHTVTFG